jgi:hypothetical protein
MIDSSMNKKQRLNKALIDFGNNNVAGLFKQENI